jgi:hypothetical protein
MDVDSLLTWVPLLGVGESDAVQIKSWVVENTNG